MRKPILYWCSMILFAVGIRVPAALAVTGGFSFWNLRLGPGDGYEESDLDQIAGIGLALGLDLGSISLGSELLNGLGVRTKIYEAMLVVSSVDKNFGTKDTFFPIYVYYPVYYKEKQINAEPWPDKVKSPYICIFAGGSRWGRGSDYVHVGISTLFGAFPLTVTGAPRQSGQRKGSIADLLNQASAEMLYDTLCMIMPVGHWDFQMGLLYSSDYTLPYQRSADPSKAGYGKSKRVNRNFLLYIAFGLGMGAFF